MEFMLPLQYPDECMDMLQVREEVARGCEILVIEDEMKTERKKILKTGTKKILLHERS